MSIKLEVWGDYALFTRPEMKVERVSYDVMTPSAARGLIEAIYWHPGMRWHIDRIHVCAPIRFTNLRRNEVKSTISARTARTVMERGKGELCLSTSEDIQQRAALLLREVRYVIEAHFEMTEQAAPGDNPGKFQDIVILSGTGLFQPDWLPFIDYTPRKEVLGCLIVVVCATGDGDKPGCHRCKYSC